MIRPGDFLVVGNPDGAGFLYCAAVRPDAGLNSEDAPVASILYGFLPIIPTTAYGPDRPSGEGMDIDAENFICFLTPEQFHAARVTGWPQNAMALHFLLGGGSHRGSA